MTVDDVERQLAEGLGAAAARAGKDTEACPYPRGTDQERALRYWWLLGFAGDGGADRELFGTQVARAKERIKRAARVAWYGREHDHQHR